MNATRHGLSATSVVVIQGVENEADYEALVAEVIADLKPVGAVEGLLAERVALLFWRLRRVVRFEMSVSRRRTVKPQALAQLLRRPLEMEHGASASVLRLTTSSNLRGTSLSRRR